jgi:hypothetical protein
MGGLLTSSTAVTTNASLDTELDDLPQPTSQKIVVYDGLKVTSILNTCYSQTLPL